MAKSKRTKSRKKRAPARISARPRVRKKRVNRISKARKTGKAAPPRGRRVNRRKPRIKSTAKRVSKTPSRRKSGARKKRESRVEKLERKLRDAAERERGYKRVIEDIQRTPTQRRRSISTSEPSDVAPDTPTRPKEYEEGPGEFEELPDAATPETWDDYLEEDFDYDDIYDDVGDEEEDSYGEDA